MVQPRFSFSAKLPSPTRVFVDRTEAINLFEETLNAAAGSKTCRILNYYGVGGIGKSALRKEIEKSHLGANTIAFAMDCRNHEDVGAGDSLIALVDSCVSSKKVKFPLFEIAYAGYFSKKYPELAPGRERKQFGDRFKIGLDILGLVDGGISNLVASLVDISYDAINKARIPKEIKQDLERFPSYSLFDIEMRLPAYFAADLQNISEKFGLIPVFLIDTFEAVNEHESRKERCFANEEWARDIIANTSGGLAVIFGRDLVNWGDEWDGLITRYHLKPLSYEHSSELLELCGVEDEPARDVLLDKANGFPLYLALLSDTYKIDPQPADALQAALHENTHLDTQILNRFLYNLTDAEAETLRVLSIANYFTQELLEFAVTRFNTGFSFTHFDEFVSYSFIESSGCNYYIQRNVRDVVNASIDKSLRARAHKAFSDYYSSAFENDEQYEHLYQLAFHKANSLDSESLLKWISSTVRPVLDRWRVRGERRKIYDLLQMLLEMLDLDSLGASLLASYTDIVHLGGDYQRSVELIDEYLSGKAGNELDDQTMLYLNTRKLHHAMFYESSKDLLSKAIKMRKGCRSELSDAVVELDFLIGGNLSVLAGNFDCAKEWLEITRAEGTACGTTNIAARIDRKLADTMLATDNKPEALSILAPYENLATKANEDLTRYEVYLLGSLGEYHRSIGDFKVAKSFFNKLLSATQARGMPGWEAHALLALSVLYIQTNQIDNALSSANAAYELYEHSKHCWGMANTAIVFSALTPKVGEAHRFLSGRTSKDEASALCFEMGYDYQAQFIGQSDLSDFRLLFL